ncbi:cupin domain-containing protein [Archaeoglobus neptunius]|uniref:cupin domain-containing protein n=1 Tax=Archaeoglobus neptunius TaxID=2798580 RepID=UPI001928143A|nr:cupin domain-containing protein [Archaeoglobus neptunius]
MNIVISGIENGDVVRENGVKYTVKAKSSNLLVVLAELEAGSETDVHRHDGEEFRFVLEGVIECIVGERSFKLKAGESILHPSDVPHKVKNVGNSKAVYLTVGTPPTFSLEE